MPAPTPLEKYQADLKRDDFAYDAAQEDAVRHLQRLYDDLVRTPRQTPDKVSDATGGGGLGSKVRRLFGKPSRT
ncbi:MAG: AFG1/ZapE family ATPase, partial [Sulfitobacter pontiacus]